MGVFNNPIALIYTARFYWSAKIRI